MSAPVTLSTANDLADIFGPSLWEGAGTATAPIFVIGVGVLLLLVFGIIDRLKPFAGIVIVATLLLALGCNISQLMGDEVPGIVLDGTFVANRVTALWGVMFCIGTLLAYGYSVGYYEREHRPFKLEHDALMLCAPAGMMLMVGAGNLVVFFVGLELLSIPLYALAAFQRSKATSVEAGLKYFLLGSFSSAIFLYGASLLYAATGTIAVVGEGNLIDHARAGDLSNLMGLAGSALLASSLFFKISAFPFHLWTPDVYEGSPTPVTALMATGTKAAAIGVLVNLTHLFPASAATYIGVIALITMAIGNLGALVQTNLKRMLAYSGIAHAGTLLLIIAAGLAGGLEENALRAALFYMGAY
ncbi:MAG: NADH-quinone oxidoreductase subunit N, partial [Planctomycetota bacterium]